MRVRVILVVNRVDIFEINAAFRTSRVFLIDIPNDMEISPENERADESNEN